MKKLNTITYLIFLLFLAFQINAQVTKPQRVTSQKELSKVLDFIKKTQTNEIQVFDYYKNYSDYITYLESVLKWAEINAEIIRAFVVYV